MADIADTFTTWPGNWVDLDTDYGGLFKTGSNTISPSTADDYGVAYYGGGTFPSAAEGNQEATVFIAFDGTYNGLWGPCVYVQPDGTGFCLVIDGNANTAQIWKMDPAGWTSVAGPTAITSPTSNDYFLLFAIGDPTNLLICSRNGTQISGLTVARPAGNTSGAAGMMARYDTGETVPQIGQFQSTDFTASSSAVYGEHGIIVPGATAHGLHGHVKH